MRGAVDLTGIRALLARTRSDMARVEATIEALAQEGERGLALSDRRLEDGRFVVHMDTYPGRRGKWRVTRLVEVGGEWMPAGHNGSTTFRAALKLAWEFGADLSRPIQESET